MIRDDKRGMVLLMVLSVLVLFTVMVVEFASDQNIDIDLAYNFKDSMQAQYIARAGVEAALLMIKEDDSAYDAEDEEWFKFSEYAMMAGAYLEEGTFSGTLVDESAKFDLNSLVNAEGVHMPERAAQFKALCGLLDIEINPDELQDLVDAIYDWIDLDSETEFGAESDYYEALDRPYFAKNGYFDTVEELLLVRGMKREYLYGQGEKEGLIKYVTVGTGGVVNINTASDTVLLALSDYIDQDVVDEIKDGRPFKNADDLGRINSLDLNMTGDSEEALAMKDLKSVLSVQSARFMVDVKGVMPIGATVNIRAAIERVEKKPRIVYYKIY